MDLIEKAEIEPLKDVTNVYQIDTEGYKKLISQAKRQAAEGYPKQALETLQRAVKIHRDDKILKKIAKLEAFISEYGQSSEEEEEDETMVHVGKGFYLHRDLYSKLYPHQKEGILWFWRLHRKKKGGILGDDMGLGKTIQVVSFLSGLFDADEVKSVLIILPVALIINWEREFEKWAPGIRVETFHTAGNHQRQRVLDKVQRRGGVLLISYGLVVTNCESLKTHNYRPFTWDYVILDEGHKIKNPTKTTKAVHAVAAHHRFILSGTPVQNNLKELWALFDFVCQGTLLGTRQTFCSMYENPITRAREKCGTASEKRLGNEMAESLRQLIAPHFLRRTKADVKRSKQSLGKNEGDEIDNRGAEMPTLTRKNDLIVWMHLSQAQIQIYQEFLSLDRVKELLMTTRSPLVELTILKKICDHPRLLSTIACQQLGLASDADLLDVDESRQKECAANLVNQIPDNVLLEESGKLQFLMGLLENLRQEGHRTLVFSQSCKMLDIIQKLLRSRDIKFLRLDGSIRKLEEREKLIKLFQDLDVYSVFLLTTQVGGVGLTLTAADRVVVFDPNWNPATDNQAVDRVYRIGQTRSVVIYRLITCGSVEEKIYRRQVFKDSITRQTTGDSKNPYRYFTRQELHELFVLDDPRVSTTQQQLEELHTGHRITDQTLDEHIAYLYSLGIFGLSDHDLMFSQEAAQETSESHANESQYIQETVQKAQTLVASECELTKQIKEHYSNQNENDGQGSQQSTGQYRDRFSLMNQLSRMQGKDVPEPPPSTGGPPNSAPAISSYDHDTNDDMVDLNFDTEQISEEELNRTMESLTFNDHKDQNSTQDMLDVDEVIDLTDDSYISTDSHKQIVPQDGKVNQQKMEFIDLTEDEETNSSHHSSNSSADIRSPTNTSSGITEHNSSNLSSLDERKKEEMSFLDGNIDEDNKDTSSLKVPNLEVNHPERSFTPSNFKEPFISSLNTSVTKSPASVEFNLLKSHKMASAKNSPATPQGYVPDSDTSMFQDSVVSEHQVSCLVEESDVEDYNKSTSSKFDENTAMQDDVVNDSLVEIDTWNQSIEVSASPQETNSYGQTLTDKVWQYEDLEERFAKSKEESDIESEEGKETSETEENLGNGSDENEEDLEDGIEENEEDLEDEIDENVEDLEDGIDENVEDLEDGIEENEEDLEDGIDENVEDFEYKIDEKDDDLTEADNKDADLGEETLDSEEEDEEDNSMDEFINDEEEEDESGSEDEDGKYSESSEDEDPMYKQLVTEGRNLEKSGSLKKALKCYLTALEMDSKDMSLQVHAYKLARAIKKSQEKHVLSSK